MLSELRDGSIPYDTVKSLGLFETSSGKVMSLDAIRKIRSPWTFAPQDNQIADRLMSSDTAICLNEKHLVILNYKGDECNFFDWLLQAAFREDRGYNGNSLQSQWSKIRSWHRCFYDAGSGLADGFSCSYVHLPQSKWTVVEKRIVKVLESYSAFPRSIGIGMSDTALAWTDGHSYIMLDREYLKRLYLGGRGASQLIHTMFHEMAHDCETNKTHVHNEEFYRTFHDITGNGLWVLADFYRKMQHSKIDEKQMALAQKESKAKERQEKKLGIAGSVAVAAKTKPKPKPAVVEPESGQPVRRRRKRF